MEDTRVDMPVLHTYEESVNDDPWAASSTFNGGLSTVSTSNDNAVEESRSKKTQQLIIDANGSNWHQSPIFAIQDKEKSSKESLQVLDFDILCATIAMQREPSSLSVERDCNEVGVQRMWEGGVLDCFDNKEIAMRTFCCPSFTYGKNLNRAGFGSCISKGGIHFSLLFGAFISYILFICAYGHLFLYLALGFLISVASYATYYRIQIRRKFNIKGSDSDGLSAFDDSLNHFICGCCTLCQEARTLEMNNVQDGNWHGRSDTILVGNYAIPSSTEHLEPTLLKQPDVVTIEPEHKSSLDGDSYDEHRPLMVHQSD